MVFYRWMLALLLLAALVLSGCNPVPPPHPGSVPDQILFIGNSHTYWQGGLDNHLQNLAASAQAPLKLDTEAITIGGATLQQLWEDGEAVDAIRTGDWDVVVLQESSGPSMVLSDSFPEYVHKFDEEIRQAGARTVLYMPSGSSAGSVDDIARAYDATAGEAGADVAPVAVAWQRARDMAPDLELYEADQVHPTMLGMYLTAAVLYATVFGKSPEGLQYLPADSLPDSEMVDLVRQQWQMSPEERETLQRIAWETVREYQMRQGSSQ